MNQQGNDSSNAPNAGSGASRGGQDGAQQSQSDRGLGQQTPAGNASQKGPQGGEQRTPGGSTQGLTGSQQSQSDQTAQPGAASDADDAINDPGMQQGGSNSNRGARDQDR